MSVKQKNLPACFPGAYWTYAIVFIFLMACGCNQPNTATHSYFDKAFKKIDSSLASEPYVYTDYDMAYMDSVFAKTKNAGRIDIANRYSRKLLYYKDAKAYYPVAILYADSIINLLQNHLDDKDLTAKYVFAHFAKGNMYARLKDFDKAIRNFTIGKLVQTTNTNDSCALFAYYESMADIYYAQKKYLLAIRFYRSQLTYATSCEKDPYLQFAILQGNLDNIGICYSRAGNTDSARFYLDSALHFIDLNEHTFPSTPPIHFVIYRAVIYSNLAPVLYQQKDTAGAEKLFLESIEGTTSFTHEQHRNYQLPLAEFYLENRQTEKAGRLLQQVRAHIGAAEMNNSIAKYHKLMSVYYNQVNQPVDAFASLLQSYTVRDSLQKMERQFYAMDINREFENTEQRTANQALKKDNQIKQSYLVAGLTGAVLAVAIGLMIWLTLKRKSVFVKELTKLHGTLQTKNEDLQKTLASLEDSHRENNHIMRIVAQDLKSPVTAMHSLAGSMLAKEEGTNNKESFELIKTTCADAVVLISDLLTNKRNLSDVSKELVDMGRLIEQCRDLFQLKAGEKKQHIWVQVDYPVVMLNRQKMLRVISNIVNNAIKFSPENATIMIRLERKAATVLLSVKDYGIGIPAFLKEKIFAIDKDKSRPGTKGEKSYGLGLAISKQIVEEHAGSLWFESADGNGSVFFVELPYSIN